MWALTEKSAYRIWSLNFVQFKWVEILLGKHPNAAASSKGWWTKPISVKQEWCILLKESAESWNQEKCPIVVRNSSILAKEDQWMDLKVANIFEYLLCMDWRSDTIDTH